LVISNSTIPMVTVITLIICADCFFLLTTFGVAAHLFKLDCRVVDSMALMRKSELCASWQFRYGMFNGQFKNVWFKPGQTKQGRTWLRLFQFGNSCNFLYTDMALWHGFPNTLTFLMVIVISISLRFL